MSEKEIRGLVVRDGILRKYVGDRPDVALPAGIKTLGDRAFARSPVTEVIIPEGVTGIGMGAFDSCSALRRISLPETLSYIGREAFGHCTSLTEICIPRGVKRLNSECFWACGKLASVTLHRDMMFGEDVFFGCHGISRLAVDDVVITTPKPGMDTRLIERIVRAVSYRCMMPRAGIFPPQISAQLAAELFFRFSAADAARFIKTNAAAVFGILADCGRDDLLIKLAGAGSLLGGDAALLETLIEKAVAREKHEVFIMLTALRHGSSPSESAADRFSL